MTKRPRPTLAERNHAAIADLATPPSAPSTPSADSPPSTASAPQTANTAQPATTITVYLSPEAYQDAQAAAIADWEIGGPESFAAWIIAALRRYAAQPPHTRHPDPAAVCGGSPKSFRVDIETRQIVDAALALDARSGTLSTRSVWAATAIRAAVELARQRGPLPSPPDRMPPRFPQAVRAT